MTVLAHIQAAQAFGCLRGVGRGGREGIETGRDHREALLYGVGGAGYCYSRGWIAIVSQGDCGGAVDLAGTKGIWLPTSGSGNCKGNHQGSRDTNWNETLDKQLQR